MDAQQQIKLLYTVWYTPKYLDHSRVYAIFDNFRLAIVEAGYHVEKDPYSELTEGRSEEDAWELVSRLAWAPNNDEVIDQETAVQRLVAFTNCERRDLATWLRQKADDLAEDPKLAAISKSDRVQMVAQGRDMFEFLLEDSSIADYLASVLQDTDLDSLLGG